MPGVISYEVDFSKDRAEVVFDTSQVSTAEIAQALADAGYAPGQIVETQ